jgi:hypothetical protein
VYRLYFIYSGGDKSYPGVKPGVSVSMRTRTSCEYLSNLKLIPFIQDSQKIVENELRIWRLLDPNPNIARFLGTGRLESWPFNSLSLVSEHYKHGDVNKVRSAQQWE